MRICEFSGNSQDTTISDSCLDAEMVSTHTHIVMVHVVVE